MQFTYPNVLWALLLLLIPIIVHLLQLRRFKKTPFTNVKLLQKVIAQSSKSQNLKKYLLLLTRLLLIASLVFAFTQPFLSENTASTERELVVYLDNSFSMEAPTNSGTLLSTAVQEFLERLPPESQFSLITNNVTIPETNLKFVQDPLLQIRPTPVQLNLEEIFLKANALFTSDTNVRKDLVIISDFQRSMALQNVTPPETIDLHAIQMTPESVLNISLDSAFISPVSSSTLELTVSLSGMEDGSIPVSLYNNDRLVAKTAAEFNSSNQSTLSFTLPQDEKLLGRISIVDNNLGYDNNLYVSLNLGEKVRVLTVNEAPVEFLERVFTDDEFELTSSTLEQLNFGAIDNYDLVVINQVRTLSQALRNTLNSFNNGGGSVLIIPSSDLDIASYNAFLASWDIQIESLLTGDTRITTIAFNHPLFANVFEEKVTNFQFPSVSERLAVNTALAPILAYQNGEPFLVGRNGKFFFTAALDAENSNFKSSPLIVPTLYGIGKQSLALPELYYQLGSQVDVDVTVSLTADEILKIVQEEYEFIPLQQAFPNKVSLKFSEPPDRDGIFAILKDRDTLRYLSINYPRSESALVYEDIPQIFNIGSLESVFNEIENTGKVTALWKWFVILALVFILAEVLIQKFMP